MPQTHLQLSNNLVETWALKAFFLDPLFRTRESQEEDKGVICFRVVLHFNEGNLFLGHLLLPPA